MTYPDIPVRFHDARHDLDGRGGGPGDAVRGERVDLLRRGVVDNAIDRGFHGHARIALEHDAVHRRLRGIPRDLILRRAVTRGKGQTNDEKPTQSKQYSVPR